MSCLYVCVCLRNSLITSIMVYVHHHHHVWETVHMCGVTLLCSLALTVLHSFWKRWNMKLADTYKCDTVFLHLDKQHCVLLWNSTIYFKLAKMQMKQREKLLYASEFFCFEMFCLYCIALFWKHCCHHRRHDCNTLYCCLVNNYIVYIVSYISLYLVFFFCNFNWLPLGMNKEWCMHISIHLTIHPPYPLYYDCIIQQKKTIIYIYLMTFNVIIGWLL